MELAELKKMRVHIVGVSGIEGLAITEYLIKNGVTNLTLHDFCEEKEFAMHVAKYNVHLDSKKRAEKIKLLKSYSSTIRFKPDYLEGIEEADLIFAGQAWYNYPQNYPRLKRAHDKGIPFGTIANLYLDRFKGTTIAVTGSNGKTTVSSLVFHILEALKKEGVVSGNCYISGNERMSGQILDIVEDTKPDDILVLEISNRQLKEKGESHPTIAHVTNISENHLSEHDGFLDYARTKVSLCDKAIAIIPDDDLISSLLENFSPTKTIVVNPDLISEYGLTSLPLKGEHNRKNIASSVAIVETLLNPANKNSITVKTIVRKAIEAFKGVPKRLEPIGVIRGCEVINDLSSTTAISTLCALDAFDDRCVSLVLGGGHKGDSFDALVEKIMERVGAGTLSRVYILPGTVREKVQSLKGDFTTMVESFEEIVALLPKDTCNTLIVSPAGEQVISRNLKNRTLSIVFGFKE